MKISSLRITYLLGLGAVIVLLIIATYLQVYEDLQPCPLCLLQRCMLTLLGLVFLIGLAKNFQKVGQIILSLFAMLFSLLGAVIAGRQVLLQYFLSNHTSNCGGSLEYMLQVLPLTQVLKKVFMGTSDCSKVDWKFLNVSLAGWSFICFCLFFLMALILLCRSYSFKQKF